MRYNELKTDLLTEAQLSPGDVREIKLKIGEYEEKLRELKNKESKLRNEVEWSIDDYPRELRDKMQAYIDAYTREIEKLKLQLQKDHPEDSFNNFIAGLKKNCSEIIKIYQHSQRFLYSGFSTDRNKTALYGKPPAEIIVPPSYKQRNFDSLKYFIENKFQMASFSNAILTSTDAYDAAMDGKIPFIVFPRNGYKYFWSPELSNFFIGTGFIARLFDRQIVMEGYNYFVGDPAMKEKFKAAGGYMYAWEREYVGSGDGFMGSYSYENNLDTIERLLKDGAIDPKWQQFTDWKAWVSPESFKSNIEIKHDELERAMNRGNDIIVNTSGVYCINERLSNKVFKALGIGYY